TPVFSSLLYPSVLFSTPVFSSLPQCSPLSVSLCSLTLLPHSSLLFSSLRPPFFHALFSSPFFHSLFFFLSTFSVFVLYLPLSFSPSLFLSFFLSAPHPPIPPLCFSPLL